MDLKNSQERKVSQKKGFFSQEDRPASWQEPGILGVIVQSSEDHWEWLAWNVTGQFVAGLRT